MQRRGSFRDNSWAAIYAHGHILSRDSLSAIRDHQISGIVASFLNALSTSSRTFTRTNNALSSSLAIRTSNVPSNRLLIRHHAKECPTMLLARMQHPAATPMLVTVVERWDTMHISAPRNRIHQPSRTRTTTRDLLDLRLQLRL